METGYGDYAVFRDSQVLSRNGCSTMGRDDVGLHPSKNSEAHFGSQWLVAHSRGLQCMTSCMRLP